MIPLKEKRDARRRATLALQDAPQFYSQEAERAVLGTMLARPDVIDDVTDELNRGDMFDPKHQELFELFVEMYEHSQAIDITTCHQRLVDLKLDKVVGSPGVLAELINGFASHLNVKAYIKIVKDKSKLRQLNSACGAIAQDVAENEDKPQEVLQRAQQTIYIIGERHGERHAVQDASELVRAHRERVEKIKGGMTVPGLKTGFGNLDKILMPFEAGTNNIIAARPGVGKTSLLLNLTDNWCEAGYGVLIFSLEMLNNQLMNRIFAYRCGFNSKSFNRPLDMEEAMRYETGCAKVGQWNLHVNDTCNLSVAQMKRDAMRTDRHRADKGLPPIDVIAIDYLQLIRGEVQKGCSREEVVAAISRDIKTMAKDLNKVTVTLAQFNRKATETAEPEIHHLRESGAIEQDADSVTILYRPQDGCTDYRSLEINAKVAKQREGPIDTATLYFDSVRTRFMDEKLAA